MRAGSRAARQHGFTYLGALFLLVLMGIGLAITGESWSLASKRLRERELLWAGDQYVRALKAYYHQSPGLKQYPQRLEELLEDRRFPQPRHHLRQLHPDPVARAPFVEIRNAQGRIAGVRSASEDAPLKQAGFAPAWEHFQGRQRHADWEFVADETLRPGGRLKAAAARPAAP